MRHLDVFRNLTSVDNRLAFYTKESKSEIPESPGCYAWVLPLWLYDEDLDNLLKMVCDLYSYDQIEKRKLNANFTWESVHLDISRGTEAKARDEMRSLWGQVMSDEEARNALQMALMEATLLMPPLYVGRTKDLSRRYIEHTSTSASDRNSFGNRFRTFTTQRRIKLSVSDLLFVCIKTEAKNFTDASIIDDTKFNQLIEQILMRFCRPPFSLK